MGGRGGGAGSDNFENFACWSALKVILFSQSFHFEHSSGPRVQSISSKSQKVLSFCWYVVWATLFFTWSCTRGMPTLILFQRMMLVNLKPNPNKNYIWKKTQSSYHFQTDQKLYTLPYWSVIFSIGSTEDIIPFLGFGMTHNRAICLVILSLVSALFNQGWQSMKPKTKHMLTSNVTEKKW